MLKEVRAEAVMDSDEDSFFIGELFLRATTKSKPNIIEKSNLDTDWDVELQVDRLVCPNGARSKTQQG